jgi:hypothetical protein
MARRELLVTHPIGERGRFKLVASSGTLRIEGVDGEVAEVRARYQAPSAVAATDDPEQDGVVEVRREDGALTVQVQDPGAAGFLAGLTRRVGGTWRPDVEFDVRIPRGAAVWLQVTSADGELRGLRGDQEIRTVSGDLELHGAGGRLKVTTVSGDVAIAGDVLLLAANTTSGDIAVDAELVQSLAGRTVSGDISVRAALGRDVVHTFESVSGDLELATVSGLTVEMSGLSGSLRTDAPSRRETRDGKKVLVIGDGVATLRARTVSGDVVIGGPRGARVPANDPFGFALDMTAFTKDMATFGAGLARDVTAATTGTRPGGWPTPPAPPTRPTPPVPPTPPTWPTPPVPPMPPDAPSAADQLAILRKLEAGEIDVEEAARRLEALA